MRVLKYKRTENNNIYIDEFHKFFSWSDIYVSYFFMSGIKSLSLCLGMIHVSLLSAVWSEEEWLLKA